MRLEAQAKAGFYPTPPKVVDIIKTWIGEKIAGSTATPRSLLRNGRAGSPNSGRRRMRRLRR